MLRTVICDSAFTASPHGLFLQHFNFRFVILLGRPEGVGGNVFCFGGSLGILSEQPLQIGPGQILQEALAIPPGWRKYWHRDSLQGGRREQTNKKTSGGCLQGPLFS